MYIKKAENVSFKVKVKIHECWKIKYFSFSISECQADSDATLTGTCFSESECKDKGGVKYGNCAQGFGACCVFK